MVAFTPDLVAAGNAILFTGAGFSIGAINQNNEEIVTAWNMTQRLLADCGINDPTDYDLESASSEYVKRKGVNNLVTFLFNNFISRDVTDAQTVVACQPWRRIYTTNYDDVIERVFTVEKKPYSVAAIHSRPEMPIKGRTQLIHIYGKAKDLSADEFRRTFVLTERQRDNPAFLSSPWFRRFNEDLLAADVIVFAGFSLRDVHIRRLLANLPRGVTEKTFFVDHPSISDPSRQRFLEYGKLKLVGIDGFARELGSKRPGEPTLAQLGIPFGLEEIQYVPQTQAAISGSDIQLLIAGGLVMHDKFSQADIQGNHGSYTIKRDDNSFNRATTNTLRPIIVHSDVGNGKTVFTNQACYAHAIAGRRVFKLTRDIDDTGRVLAFAQSIDFPAVISADDITRFPTIFNKIGALRNSNIALIGTVRSSLMESAPQRVSTIVGQSFVEIDLNISRSAEIDRLIRYFDENSLWGDYAELSGIEKRTFVLRRCGGQIRDVVLTMFETGSLRDRVLQAIRDIEGLEDDEIKLITLSALLNIAGLDRFCDLIILRELTKYDGTFEELRQRLIDCQVGGLISAAGGRLSLRSPAFAQFFLRHSVGLERIIEVAKQALFALDRYFSDDAELEVISRQLLRYSTYNRLFDLRNEQTRFEDFYDEARTLRIAIGDPLFQVQRSIAAMSGKQFALSEQFIRTARGLASAKPGNFDTFQIDTHEAKFLLTRCEAEGVSPDALKEQHAMNLIASVLQRHDDSLYHPLSVFRILPDIVNKWMTLLTDTQRVALGQIIDRSLRHINLFPQGLRDRYPGLGAIVQRLNTAKGSLRS